MNCLWNPPDEQAHAFLKSKDPEFFVELGCHIPRLTHYKVPLQDILLNIVVVPNDWSLAGTIDRLAAFPYFSAVCFVALTSVEGAVSPWVQKRHDLMEML
uniref:Glucuronosyltransferase n=1 Tax=Steinernema glaseri TaxID=37863 RepID=A0A1I8AE18_9BILA